MLTLLIFFLILSVLILIHELGHFFMAKKNGVLVEEFGLGIPPRIFGKKIGDTIYSINLLPFGGFVKLFGEDLEDNTQELRSNPKSFMSKKPLQRILILGSGVFMNMVLAVTAYFFLFSQTNFKSLTLPVFFDYKFKYGQEIRIDTVISGFSEDSNAQQAGMQVGEAITEINGVSVKNIDEVRKAVKYRPNQEVSVKLLDVRDSLKNNYRTLNFTTQTDEEGNGILGVFIMNSVRIYYPKKILAPLQHSANMLAYTFSTLRQFVRIAVETKSVEPVTSGVTGPVGIYSVVGGILSYGGKESLMGLVDFIGLLSLSLAFMNLLPLPALDGGRIIFAFYELITRKQVNQKIEGAIHRIGMLFFFGLLILITIKDITRFF